MRYGWHSNEKESKMRSTINGTLSASGIGCRHNAAETLLRRLCRSGCVLDKMETYNVGWGGGVLIRYTVSGTDSELSVLIRYTVSGTDSELSAFRRLAEK